MKEKIEIFQEHGGVLHSTFGRAETTFFGHQIHLEDEKVKITPTIVTINVDSEEKSVFASLAKPLSAKILYGRSKSLINELAFLNADPNEKKELLKSLRSELGKLIKEVA